MLHIKRLFQLIALLTGIPGLGTDRHRQDVAQKEHKKRVSDRVDSYQRKDAPRPAQKLRAADAWQCRVP